MNPSRFAASRAFLFVFAFAVLTGCGAAATQSAKPESAPLEPAVAIPNARAPAPGILTGGQPTPAQLEQARDAGFRTVVSLRTPGEPGSEDEAATVEALGMRFVSIPVAGAEGLTEANVQALGAVLADEQAKPVLLHCASGNRAGALLALEAFYIESVPAEQALELGKAAGLVGLEPAVRSRLGL